MAGQAHALAAVSAAKWG